jgi:hypothetical protein
MLTEIDPESAAAIVRLDRYRLEHDLTFEDLAREMTDAGFAIKPRTLHLVLRGHIGTPRDRLRFKIREFVARQDRTATPDDEPRA